MFSEMNILKNLDHPHIVKLFELYQDENNYYLVTEYYCSYLDISLVESYSIGLKKCHHSVKILLQITFVKYF